MTAAPTSRALVEAFRANTIAHPILRQVDRAARQAITALDSKNIVLIYGPTGVGKTTLIKRIKRTLDEEIADELRADTTRALVPIVSAVAPEATTFSWKDFYSRTLEALNHRYAEAQVRSAGPRPNSNDLRRRLENALQATRPRAVIVDEAHHIGVGSSAAQLIKQLEIIKSHAEASGTRYVLVGTYALLAFRNLNGQLSRRSRDVHFPRYGMAELEIAAFRETLSQLSASLPLPAPSLTAAWEDIYERTAGCVGILKDWLTQALAEALSDGSQSVEWRHLAQTALSVSAMTSIAAEIKEGEDTLTETLEARDRLRGLLGLGAPQPAVPDVERGRTRKPGQRAPTRDRVRQSNTPETASVAA